MRVFLAVMVIVSAIWASAPVDIEKLKAAAEAGDAQAQFDLGFVYGQGIEGEPDATKAQKWWQKAAKAGHSDAQTNLGVMLMSQERYSEAAQWLQKGVDQNDTLAMCHLAELYATGRGVDKSRDRARELASKGFEAGQKRCQNVWYLYRLDTP
jgi:TPR repeat protein